MDDFLSKLDFGKAAVISVFAINIICPGFISIACLYPDLFLKLDIFKLLLLSISVSFPFLLLTIFLHIGLTSDGKRNFPDDASYLTLTASMINTCHWIVLGIVCIIYSHLSKTPSNDVMIMIIIFGSVLIYVFAIAVALYKQGK